MIYNIDLHIQTPYTAATSDNLTVKNLSRFANLKGVDIIGTGDCLHPDWRESLYDVLNERDGYYEYGGTFYVPSVEVKDADAVHHLILCEDLDDFGELRDRWGRHSKIDGIGVPTINLTGEELAEDVFDVGGVIGPAHVFIQWESLYMSFDSIYECYGEYTDRISFYELGLSASSSMVDGIDELESMVALSNSDLHTVYKLGRETTQVELPEPSFAELRRAFETEQDRFQQNFGVPPQPGKYYESACIECGGLYRLEDAKKVRWTCSCGGSIRKGTKHRIQELTGKEPSVEETDSYTIRPPLLKCIEWSRESASPDVKRTLWGKLINRLGTEFDVLHNVPIADIAEVDAGVASLVEDVRNNEVEYSLGGGGTEGRPVSGPDAWEYESVAQQTLGDY